MPWLMNKPLFTLSHRLFSVANHHTTAITSKETPHNKDFKHTHTTHTHQLNTQLFFFFIDKSYFTVLHPHMDSNSSCTAYSFPTSHFDNYIHTINHVNYYVHVLYFASKVPSSQKQQHKTPLYWSFSSSSDTSTIVHWVRTHTHI